jgi:uncharacterized protein
MRVAATLAALTLPFMTVPALAQTDPLAPVPVEKQALTDVDPALWVVRDKDTTIYMFGTIHLLRPGLGWFDDGVKAAFDKSDTLVLEIVDPDPAEVAKIMSDLAFDKSGKTIRQKLPAADVPAYEAAVAKLGLPVEALDPLDGWAVALNLYLAGIATSGYDPNSGVETVLKAAAAGRKLPVVPLETMRMQMEIFDSMPPELQTQYVTETVKGMDLIAAQTDMLVDAWATANPDGVATLMNEGFEQLDLVEPLLTRRNANWARWINQRMKQPGTVFMAVGAGHLAGTVSVQQLLTAYGLDSERVAY